ncbi:K+-transporting ATPase, F subunit [Nostoc sp. NIES-3756]|uniref:potassium-transporting ATPase subunit F n=1 Tax=Nostoc sp. NIES-3756 TaxID=1751286 RepID=UPI0007219CB8|nr:potassium-transporting ATPase subunit F [Nostoc sp. NIES-3756]BAT54235.1 K+-transporting ATPase, F subunit [Nostoc sp. NIES-3756]BAY38025.1 K+-transporting ATPase subunit F [Nostoc sp. NIES-2111]
MKSIRSSFSQSPIPKFKQKLPLFLFLAMCFNLVVAPVVYAATGEQFSHFQAWALGLLGLVTLSLSIYLFFVMFIPEKF